MMQELPAATFLALGNKAKGVLTLHGKVEEGTNKSLQFSNSQQWG